MNTGKLSRREALTRTALVAGGSLAGVTMTAFRGLAAAASARPLHDTQVSYCLNTATLRGQKLGIVREIEVASQAGYHGIEPWVESVDAYVNGGGTLTDLKKRVSDAGLVVEGAIAFPEWIVDDAERRAKGLELAKRQMERMAAIGGRRIAAPPAGATGLPKLDLVQAAERYRALLEAAESIGPVPMLELWGFSKNLGRLGECAFVAVESGHRNACVLPDVFHLYKGGSDFHGLQTLAGTALPVLHLNDYPAEPPRDKIDDSYRLYPGDGVALLTEILRVFLRTGGPKVISLELFNRQYWAEDPLAVAKAGLAKMKKAVAEALG